MKAWTRLAVGLLLLLASMSSAQGIRTPADFFGFDLGADGRLIQWQHLEAYYRHLAEVSPDANLSTVGITQGGRNLVALVIGKDADGDLDALKARQRSLSKGTAGLDELDESLRTHPAVVVVQATLHSTEIAASITLPLLAHQLLTDQSERGQRLRKEVLVVMVPSANPDGQDLVVSWYDQHLGSPFEGTSPPELYQPFAGHDNNRDWFMLSLGETQIISRLLYDTWFPQVFLDIHQMGGNGPRMFVPPFSDPVNPNLPSLLLRHLDFFGAAMAMDLSRAGLTGVVQDTTFDGWWHGGARSVPCRHNMVGILTETASARLASPRIVEPGRATGLGEGLPEPKRQGNYPDPYEGGIWRMGDAIRYQMVSTLAVLDHASRYRRHLLFDQHAMARKSIELGTTSAPYGWWLPRDSRSPKALKRLVSNLVQTGVAVHTLLGDTSMGDQVLRKGSIVILADQPYRAHAKDLLEIQHYPELRLGRSGPVIKPYDAAGWTLPLQFGLEVSELRAPVLDRSNLEPLDERFGWTEEWPAASGALALDLNHSAAFQIANEATLAGAQPVYELSPDRCSLIFSGQDLEILRAKVEGSGVALRPAPTSNPGKGVPESTPNANSSAQGPRSYRVPRVAILQPYPESMDGGWTRLVLLEHAFPTTILHPFDIVQGPLTGRFDTIILPSASPDAFLKGPEGRMPASYDQALGAEGLRALANFVHEGGQLVALDESIPLALQVAAHGDGASAEPRSSAPATPTYLPGKDVTLPGSILHAQLEETHGTWLRGLSRRIFIYATSPSLLHIPSDDGGSGWSVAARFSRAGPHLASGYLSGGDALNGRPILAKHRYGAGSIHLFAFRPQHRSQTIGTFPLLFRALIHQPPTR